MATTVPRAPDLREPSPCIRAALDLPLRVELSDTSRARLEVVAARAMVRGEVTLSDWIRTYELAVDAVDAVLHEVDERIERVQSDLLALEDPNDLRQRLAQQPRREVERVRGDVRTAIQSVAREWSDRTRRQLEHVRTQCNATGQQSLPLVEVSASPQLEIRLDDAWARDYAQHVVRCCDEWTRTTLSGVDAALVAAVAARCQPLRPRPDVPGPATPAAGEPIAAAWRPGEAAPVKRAAIPGMGAALGSYLRANLMIIGMFSGVFMTLVWIAGVAFVGDAAPNAVGPARIDGTLVRGGLMLAGLPVLILLGRRAARTKIAEARDAARNGQRDVLLRHVRGESDANLERHRQALDRAIARRSDAWIAAVDAWIAGAVAPTFDAADEDAAARIRDIKLRQGKLSDALQTLRTARGQLTQNIGFELRKRLRELQELAVAVAT